MSEIIRLLFYVGESKIALVFIALAIVAGVILALAGNVAGQAVVSVLSKH